jgi:hypothetical protein
MTIPLPCEVYRAAPAGGVPGTIAGKSFYIFKLRQDRLVPPAVLPPAVGPASWPVVRRVRPVRPLEVFVRFLRAESPPQPTAQPAPSLLPYSALLLRRLRKIRIPKTTAIAADTSRNVVPSIVESPFLLSLIGAITCFQSWGINRESAA